MSQSPPVCRVLRAVRAAARRENIGGLSTAVEAVDEISHLEVRVFGVPKWLLCPTVATWMSSQATEPLELQVWTEMRFCRTCWQGALVVGRHPGGARCTGGSLPCGLWWVHEKKEVMSPELRYFSRLTEIYGKLLPELSLFTGC